jgi:SnoaL-like polyketide cyclase
MEITMLDRRALLAATPAALAVGFSPAKVSALERKPGAAVAIVGRFWREVWQKPQNPDAIDRLCTENFIITTGGRDISSRAAFKEWVIGFQTKISDFDLEVLESFENAEQTRVASRMRLTGINKGLFGPTVGPFILLVTSIMAVREDGLLEHNWVERNSWEVHQALSKG